MDNRTFLLPLVFCSVALAQQAAPAHTDTVIVTGTWQPLTLDEADRSVNTYSVRDGVLLFGDLTQVFSQDADVYIQPRGAAGTQQDISIRGASYQETLFLVNGIRVNDEQSAHYNSDFAVPMDAIQNVEILRGSGSTLYGSDAAGGVINIRTRPSSDDAPPLEMTIRGDGGSFNTFEQSGFVAYTLGRVSQRIAFDREQSDGFMDDREYRNFAVSSDLWLRTSLGLTREFLGIEDRPFGADQFYGPFNSWERTKTWLAQISQDLGKNTLATVGYRRHTDLFVLLRDFPSVYQNHHIDEGWDGALRRNDGIRKWARLYYGTEIDSDSVHSNNLGLHSRTQGAVYAAFDARSLRRASVTAGAREEFYTGGHIFVPNVSGGYWFTRWIKARGSVSKSFRLPSYTELYYSDPANVGNPNLKPERSTNYDAGIDFHPKDKLRASAVYFGRRERDGIDYVRASADDIWTATNFDHVNFDGFEADAAMTLPHGQTAQVGYTVIHGAQNALQGLQSKYVFNFPTQQFVASWERLSPAGWVARVRAGVTNQYERAAYTLVDVSAGWTKSRFHPYVRATNLADVDYQPVLGVTMPGRAFMGGLEVALLGYRQ